MNPKISVIVPVYGVEKYIHKCIDSILAQTFTDFECILVDDCSKDNCPAICDEYTQKDKRIKVIHNKKNAGSSLSRKIGLQNSFGEYILFVDADDYIETDMLEKMYVKAISDDYDMVYCDHYRCDKFNNVFIRKAPKLSDDFVINIKYCVLNRIGGTGVVWNKLVKKSIYENVEFPVDGYNECRYITAQTLFYSKKIEYVNAPLYHYQHRPESWVHDPKKKWARYKGAKNNFRKIFAFLRKVHGQNLSAFEPELSNRIEKTKNMNPLPPKEIIRKVLRIIVPFKSLRMLLKRIYNKIK